MPIVSWNYSMRSIVLEACPDDCPTCQAPRIVAVVDRVVRDDQRRQRSKLAELHRQYLETKYKIERVR
jgi:hypothetical protein